jgi:NADP-dependent 3-hydroxy acid dehydrogenase YdfG
MTNQYPRIAIVTGATSGIGEATTRNFIAAGYAVIGTGRNASKLADLEKELGHHFCGIPGDAADEDLLEKLFETAHERFNQPVDIVVANAGRGLGGSVKDADISQFYDVIKVNVIGALALMQKAAKRMVELQKNRYPKSAADIIVIGSVAGRNISPFSAVYGSTKFAVGSLAEGLRREIGPLGVRVTLVAPGIVISGFQEAAGYTDKMVQNFHEKFGPVLAPEDVANTIQFIVSQPPHIHISDIVVRPTRQDYP